MRCVFIGDIGKFGFISDVLEEKEIELQDAGVISKITRAVNPAVANKPDVLVIDLQNFDNTPSEISSEIKKIQNTRDNGKIIFLYAGAGIDTPVIKELVAAGYVNFVLDATYGLQKEKFCICLTDYYEKNPKETVAAMPTAKSVKDIAIYAFAGTQHRIGTTTQALLYAGYLCDIGYKACYIDNSGSSLLSAIEECYKYASRKGDCVTYSGIPMYAKKSLPELYKMEYTHFVVDLGSTTENSFDTVFFINPKAKRLIVAGANPLELKFTKRILRQSAFSDAAYIFSFVPDSDTAQVKGMFSSSPLFAGYVSDPFERNLNQQKATYSGVPQLNVLVQKKESKKTNLKLFGNKKRKVGK